MTAQHKIQPEILTILAACVIDEEKVLITSGQLDRKTYADVNKVLDLMGGKWNRSAKAHIFTEDPTDLMDTVLLTGEITDTKKLFQQFYTPDAVADRVVSLAGDLAGKIIGEPSAGKGRILDAICRADPDHRRQGTIAIELDPVNALYLRAMKHRWDKVNSDISHFEVIEGDFLRKGVTRSFDLILMNPPFTRGQAIKHIEHAMKFVRPGGKVIAICPDGTRERAALNIHASTWEVLPAGSFAESGTNVRTALLEICI